MTPTTTRPRRLILRDDEAAALAGAGRAVVWREMKRQPPSVEAVRAMSGSGYSWFTDHRSEPGWFRVAGPVWAVRKLDETMANEGIRCPWKPGDAAWGAEAWSILDRHVDGYDRDSPVVIGFRADDSLYSFESGPFRHQADRPSNFNGVVWRPSSTLPRELSRLPRLVAAAVSVEERGGRWGWQIEVERSEAR